MASKNSIKVWGVIPARYASRRFPGKMLAPLHGRTLVHETFANASRASRLDTLLIATDDQRIADHAATFSAPCCLTPPCPTGTDRVACVISRLKNSEQPDIVVNIQGDEPALDPRVIDRLVDTLQADPSLPVATAASSSLDCSGYDNPSTVKCVLNLKGEALYFSRALLPFGHEGNCQSGVHYYHHIGIYAFRTPFLLHYTNLPPTPLQKAEDLEQLKIIEHGFRLRVIVVDEQPAGVDTPHDLARTEEWLSLKQ